MDAEPSIAMLGRSGRTEHPGRVPPAGSPLGAEGSLRLSRGIVSLTSIAHRSPCTYGWPRLASTEASERGRSVARPRMRRRGIVGLVGASALVAALASGLALAQSSSASYQIPRQSIDGGGGRATSASYTLHGTIGQPDAGPTMTSASYTLRGGFHLAGASAPLPDALFSDGFEAP